MCVSTKRAEDTVTGAVAKYQLLYFGIRGRAQPIRYLCVDNGIDLEDVAPDNWADKQKATTPFGQLPVLKDGDFQVAQSNTILRYLGRKHDLHPTDDKESAKVDMINDHVEDVRLAYTKMIYQNYDDGKEEYVKGMAAKLQPLEKLLKAWGNDFIVSKVSFADYNLFDALDIHKILAPGCLDAFPTLKAYYERIGKRPNLQKLRESEEFKKLNVNGNGKQ